MKKLALIAIIILVAFLILVWLLFLRKKPVQFSTAVVQKTNIVSIVSASGKVSSENEAELSFKISGKVNWIGPKVGDEVKKGQVIATLDKKDLEITLSQKEAALRTAEADLEKVIDDIREHNWAKPAPITETYSQKMNRVAAESARDSAYEAVLAAKEAIKNTNLVSPIPGILVSRNTEIGQNVTANVPVFEVADLSKLIFLAEIDETDVGKIKVGQNANIILDAYPDKGIAGEIIKIYPQTSTTSTGANIIKTEIKIKDNNFPLQLGLSGDVEIQAGKKENVLTVPQEAILDEGKKHFVFVIQNEIARKREVKIGISSEDRIEIEEGLNEGAVVIASNVDKVKEGVKIKSAKK